MQYDLDRHSVLFCYQSFLNIMVNGCTFQGSNSHLHFASFFFNEGSSLKGKNLFL